MRDGSQKGSGRAETVLQKAKAMVGLVDMQKKLISSKDLFFSNDFVSLAESVQTLFLGQCWPTFQL